MKTVIIIVGAARSGSTLLAKAIGIHTKCFALGEINRFNNEINTPNTQCGCGKLLHNCDFWKEILSDLKVKFNQHNKSFQVGIFKQLTSNSKFVKLLPTIFFKKTFKDKEVNVLIDNTFRLYNKILSQTDTEILIDSTKGLFRALVLASRAPKNINIKFIHLTRDGRGVLNSALKTSYKINNKDGSVKEYEGIKDKNPNKVINSWLYVNIRNYIILKFFNKKNTIFIKYEDFTSNPKKELTRVYDKLNLDFEGDVMNLDATQNHIMGGNPSRINAKSINKQDDAWRKNLSNKNLKKFNFKAAWFNTLIGYK